MSITMNDLSKFKFYAHKVMPLVYDESLSYYEFLCKVIAKLNEVIENENEQNTAIEDFSVQMDEWNEEAIAKYNEFTAQIDVAIEEFETEMRDRATAFETSMNDEWNDFFDRYLQTLGVVQVTGESTTDVMSQKAVTDELNRRVVVDGVTGVGLRSARNATGVGNVAVGENSSLNLTTGQHNTTVGYAAGSNLTTGNDNTLLGYNSKTTAVDTINAIAIGRNTQVGTQSISVGSNSSATGSLGVALGDSANVTGNRSIAIGKATSATHNGSVAIGTDSMNNGATTTANDEIVLGTIRHTVKVPGTIANVTINGATLNSPTLQSATVINGGVSNTTRLNTPNVYDPIIRATTASFVYGDELVTNLATWGAEGATYNNGWIISEGGVIRGNVSVEANKNYLITLTVTNRSAVTPNEYLKPLRIALGDDEISIFGGNDANWNVLLSPSTGGTVVASIGGSDWYGTITGVSIKEVVDVPNYQINLQGTTNGIGTNSLNVYIGNGGKELSLGSARNVAIGINAQQHIKTGTGNVGIGDYAQQNITNGSHNVGVGQTAQKALTTGMYNSAVGYSAQSKLTSGSWNIAMGNEAQRDLTTGNNNVSLGRRAHNDLTTGHKNVAIGSQAGFARATDLTDPDTTSTSYATKTGEEQVLIGFQATQTLNTQGTANGAIAIGARAMANTNSVSIGRLTKAGAAGSVAIGVDSSGNAAEAIDENEIVIGTEAHTIKLCGKIISFNQDGTVTWTAE